MKWFITLIVLILALAPLAGQVNEKLEPMKPMKFRFEAREPFFVMGLETKNAMESEAMVDIWTKFFALKDTLPEPVGNCSYGIYYPGEDYDPTTMQGYNYFVGLEVKEPVELPENLLIHAVPGGYYAIFNYVGPISDIGNAYEYIFGEWLASSSYIPALGEMFETYDERFDGESADSVAEIWIPVQKRELKPAPEGLPLKENNPGKKLSD